MVLCIVKWHTDIITQHLFYPSTNEMTSNYVHQYYYHHCYSFNLFFNILIM